MHAEFVLLPAAIFFAAILLIRACLRRMRTVRRGSARKARKVTEQVLLAGVVLVAGFLGVCSAFNAVALKVFWSKNPPPGQVLDVNGHKMRIDCTGAGSPTLVLDAGGGNDGEIWNQLQPTFSKTTRVCSYDRAGFGWSDTQPGPRDADHIAAELHALLVRAGVTGPIVLMGHSIAGLYIRDYVNHFPQNVAGLIFVDSSTPLQDKNPAFKSTGRGPPAWLLHSALVLGVPRLIGMCTGGPATDVLRQQREEDTCGLRFGSMMAEVDNFDRSSNEDLHTTNYGSLPILIFSHDPAKVLGTHPSDQERARQAAWSAMQQNLMQLSTHSRRIVAARAGHYVFFDRTHLIEDEVPVFIDEIRGTAPQPVYGTTVTE